LNARDTTLAYASRAQQADIAPPERRDGLGDALVTNDRTASMWTRRRQWHGHNAFIRDGERVFRTYFINAAATRRWEPPGATSI